jgi:hypothetical protein
LLLRDREICKKKSLSGDIPVERALKARIQGEKRRERWLDMRKQWEQGRVATGYTRGYSELSEGRGVL